MKSLRILMLAGLCSYATTAGGLADELPRNVGQSDASEAPLDEKVDDRSNANDAVSPPKAESTKPQEEKEASSHDEATQTELIHEERWVLGIQCDAADPLLRKHLKLGSAGLVILQVRAETPAAESDLQPNDLITHIDDELLMCRDDLIKAVTLSNGATLTLTVLREGEPRKIQVTPRRMMVPVMMSPAISRSGTDNKEVDGEETREGKIFEGVLIQGMIPFDENNLEGIDVEALVRQLREMTAKDLKHESDGSNGIVLTIPDSEPSEHLSDEQLRRNIAALKDHIQTLQKKLAKLESRLKENKSPAP